VDPHYRIEINDNIVSFYSGNEFTCYEYYDNLETINIVLNTNYKVISSNADSVEDNKYMWTITEDGNKNIEISYEQYVSKSSKATTIILIVGLVVIGSVVGYYIYNKCKKENKI